ncbi:hypothetical protein DS909_08520 [Phaeobacter gallaeciensis]|uniref:Uncharacterized protein n=2 Tax=Roseobacteraceae TaxID=2854170 RepID=A0A366WZR0_9RHOB|nr:MULTISPECIES: hypothetical protein [Roseobacteraceae]MBT3140019.1 hypothetical protein [Falsiruegeria litorea]MBT8167166.1 hypothetical protein [Falsiruegeria litorea]RBW57037.1 hypothetical protein DS909_08520 [Phaeobacter gallaeciensis]
MAAAEQQSGIKKELPDALAELQSKVETLYLSQQTLERQVQALKATHPVVCRRPVQPVFPMRILLRFHKGLRERYQVAVLRDCGLLDSVWYLRNYPDVRKAGTDPVLHFLRFGAAERRDPGPYFDTTHYLHLYPDIMQSGLNPLWHYLTSGWREKRSIRPEIPHEDLR